MAGRFYVEDTVLLKNDPSISAMVEQTWRDIDSLLYTHPEDFISHPGVPKGIYKQCLREGKPPKDYVLIRFSHPYSGCTLVKESSLLLMDRGLVVGDVVKKHPSDIESGYVIKTSIECTIEPIYFDLPWSRSHPWSFKAEDYRIKVPAEELVFPDIMPGDFVLYKGWFGEVESINEQVTLRLEDGGIVRVRNAESLEICPYLHAEPSPAGSKRNLLQQLKDSKEANLSRNYDKERACPAGFFYPGQEVWTKKSNLRLGSWVVGSYDPSVTPRGTVVEVHIVAILMDWMTPNIFDERPTVEDRTAAPPSVLNGEQLDEIRIYNRNNVSSDSGLASNNYGSRLGHDIGVTDYVKFRDINAAASKYSSSSPNRENAGVFQRIPREATSGFDMNTFTVCETSTLVSVQWQDGNVEEITAKDLIPYLQVDDNDLWVGEVCSLKSAETKDGSRLSLGKIGVVQSVNARERVATVRWLQDFDVALFDDRLNHLLPMCKFGTLSDKESQVSVYEVAVYPALTKRRGDIVAIASSENMSSETNGEARVPVLNGDQSSESEPRWIGEVVDLGLDGLLTVRLGGLTEVEDIKVPVTRVHVIVGGDDDEVASELNSNGEYDTDTDTDTEYDAEKDMELILGDRPPSSDSDMYEEFHDSDVAIEEVIEYEGGERLDDGENSDDWIDEDDSGHSDDDKNSDHKEDNENGGDIEMVLGEVESEGAQGQVVHEATVIDNPARPSIKTKGSSIPKPLADYNFPSFGNMPTPFDVLEEDIPADHHFLSQKIKLSSKQFRRISKEHSILHNSLPHGIWVRTWESRLDLLRVLIIGPRGTPYELAPFVLDVHFDADYPQSPPQVYFHSWTFGVGRINPNLYEDGKVCLSVLGTWPEGTKGEGGWSPDKSSLLQVLVSLMGLVLVEEPYYNEAGFESLIGTEETILPSQIYSEKAYCMAKGFIAHALSNDVAPFKDTLQWLYTRQTGPQLLRAALEESQARMAGDEDGNGEVQHRLSTGAKVLIDKYIKLLEQVMTETETETVGR